MKSLQCWRIPMRSCARESPPSVAPPIRALDHKDAGEVLSRIHRPVGPVCAAVGERSRYFAHYLKTEAVAAVCVTNRSLCICAA
jgi:hypothetical protein